MKPKKRNAVVKLMEFLGINWNRKSAKIEAEILAVKKIKNGVEKGYKIYIELDEALKLFYSRAKLIDVLDEKGNLIGLKSIRRDDDYDKCVTILQSHPKLRFAYSLMDKVSVKTLMP